MYFLLSTHGVVFECSNITPGIILRSKNLFGSTITPWGYIQVSIKTPRGYTHGATVNNIRKKRNTRENEHFERINTS
jgi:hypothetical protein